MGVNKDVKETVIRRDKIGVTKMSRKRDYYLSIIYQVPYDWVPILCVVLSVIVDVLPLRLWTYYLNKRLL